MDLMKMATQILGSQLSKANNGSQDMLQNVIGELIGGGKSNNIDLGGLLKGLQSNGMADIAKSWLGDGDNDKISGSQVEGLLGADKVKAAAEKLGTDSGDLLSGLQEMLPQIMDKSSKGGELLDSVGGLSGLAGLASKLLRR